jgi:acetyl esterase/lipase
MSVTIERDLTFGTGGGRDLLCNVITKDGGSDKRTALVFFHGGGFVAGNKDGIDVRVSHYAALGYVCVVAGYRLAGESKFPAQINDAKAAIRWTRANAAKLNIEPERIAVVGFSAGGLLALLSSSAPDNAELEGDGGNADTSSTVAACLAYYASIDVPRPPAGSQHPLFEADASDVTFASARPATHVTASFPPTVFFHGTWDATIPIASSERFYTKLRELGVAAEFHAVEGVPHAFDRHEEFGAACAHFGDLFLDRHLVNPREYPPFQSGER